MALMKLSAIGITNLSGKAGGSIFSHNQGGKYVKNFAVPTNPRSPAQQQARSLFGTTAVAYSALSAQLKEGWKEATALFPRVDRFGDQKILSGIALFQSLNKTLLQIDVGIKTAIPVPASPRSVNSVAAILEADPVTGVNNFTLSGNTFLSGADTTEVMIFATSVRPVGTLSPNGGYRYIGHSLAQPADGRYSRNYIDPYENIYGTIPDTGRIFIKIQTVNTAQGQRGSTLYTHFNITSVS